MKNLQLCVILFLSPLLVGSLICQDRPSLTGQGDLKIPSSELYIIYDQMDNPGTNSITSQNFEAGLDIYDSFAADDFALMDMTWNIESIDVIGVYNNGSGPATSVNVWIYSCNGSGGLPMDIVYSALNIIPSAGLVDGSFSISLPVTAVLNEGWYWLCVQANMDFASGGQWLWTERTVQSFSESAWKNPGGGFGTICTPSWGYRVTDCVVGTQPDNCFRLNGYVTPVELISFTAESSDNGVILNWSTSTETNNSGFEIERQLQGDQYKTIAFIPGCGTTTEKHDYIYSDKNLTSGKYKYMLKQIDLDGSFEYSDELEIEFKGSFTFILEQNYPNPFNPSTKISWQSPVGSWQTLKVYDVLGNEVATLVDEEKPAGNYNFEFNADGLSSGVYFYQLKATPNGGQAGGYIETKKMILTK